MLGGGRAHGTYTQVLLTGPHVHFEPVSADTDQAKTYFFTECTVHPGNAIDP